VDAFTNRPFGGNPAAIVPLDHWKNDQWLQNVAMEMNSHALAAMSHGRDWLDTPPIPH
jgi:predicted PhzF superfamily epimerase YddE/YHI9